MIKEILLALAACVLVSPAVAETGETVARIDVLPGWQTPEGTQMAALRITLAHGWKTYWRAPGDGGIPPQLTLDPAANVRDFTFHWPVPEVMDQNGLRTIGYHDGFVLPIELQAADPNAPMRLTGTLDIGVCDDICVPAQLVFDAPIPAGGDRDSAIMAALIDQPMDAVEGKVTAATCAVAANGSGLVVTATLTMPQLGPHEVVVIEAGNPGIWVSQADTTRAGDTIVAVADMISYTGDSFAVDRSAMRFTVFGETGVVDIQGCTAG